jgi:hypothetical protein
MPRPNAPAPARGQALVESALTMPLVFALVLGCLQFALYCHARDVLVGAAQEGARLAAEDGRTLDDGVRRAETLVQVGLGTTVTPLEVDSPTGSDDDDVVLHLAAQLQPILPLPVGVGLPLDVRASVMRERFRPDARQV